MPRLITRGGKCIFTAVAGLLCATVLMTAMPASAQAVAASSYIGMGTTGGTPSGDVAAAIKPVIRSMEVPMAIRETEIDAADLVQVPVMAEFPRPMRIGIEASLALSAQARWLAYTVSEIEYVLGKGNVEVLWLDRHSLDLGARSRQLDFIVADADTFALTQATGLYEPIASFLPLTASRAEDAQSSVFFTRRSRYIPTIAAVGIQKNEIAALSSESLTGWKAPLALMQQMGLNGADALDRTTFYGYSAEAVVRGVLSGAQGVGVLPACVLEMLEREGKISIDRDLSVISPRTDDTLRCLHTTPVYPGWSFGALTTTDPGWKRAMSSILYSTNSPLFGGEWTVPAVNRAVYDLFYELKIGPYEHLATWSLERMLRENAEFLAIALLVAFLVILYAVSLSVLVRRKTRQLRRALSERQMIEAEAAQSRQHIANLERTGIVGQMSTIIAHELKQPLAAIVNFANSLNRRTKQGKMDEKAFTFALGEIIAQAERANEIVNRVRAYAKHDYPPRKVTDLYDVVSNAITTFRRSRQTAADVIVRVNKGSMAEVDAWEIELAVLNLMKNAADATSGVDSPRIEVTLVPVDGKTWALSVTDNGPYLDDEQFGALFKPLQTTKGSAGMGLGLSIVSSIAERHAGNITVERNGEAGLRFTITFPRLAHPDGELADEMLPPKMQIYHGTPGAALQPAREVDESAPAEQQTGLKPKETQVHGL
ncbi:sensor histidine kinase [Sutterella sp.]|uniref:sensor histidine kinase n=1 Tax=Sutterella sp. TaxID=1981025 RepID=UPI0026E0E45E|nr:sensor histidine kinase [Sutterella sp.]MDO5532889.1 PhnD/SsuA/transferrin family substrate-binding protein [Sutterella sp.]